MTTVPLVAFAVAARRLTLAALGMLQYISPTLQFLLGVTHHIRDGVDGRRAPNQVEDIPELQAGLRAGDQFNTRTVKARDHHVIALFYLQIAYFLAKNVLVSHHNAFHAHIGAAG